MELSAIALFLCIERFAFSLDAIACLVSSLTLHLVHLFGHIVDVFLSRRPILALSITVLLVGIVVELKAALCLVYRGAWGVPGEFLLRRFSINRVGFFDLAYSIEKASRGLRDSVQWRLNDLLGDVMVFIRGEAVNGTGENIWKAGIECGVGSLHTQDLLRM